MGRKLWNILVIIIGILVILGILISSYQKDVLFSPGEISDDYFQLSSSYSSTPKCAEDKYGTHAGICNEEGNVFCKSQGRYCECSCEEVPGIFGGTIKRCRWGQERICQTGITTDEQGNEICHICRSGNVDGVGGAGCVSFPVDEGICPYSSEDESINEGESFEEDVVSDPFAR